MGWEGGGEGGLLSTSAELFPMIRRNVFGLHKLKGV